MLLFFFHIGCVTKSQSFVRMRIYQWALVFPSGLSQSPPGTSPGYFLLYIETHPSDSPLSALLCLLPLWLYAPPNYVAPMALCFPSWDILLFPSFCDNVSNSFVTFVLCRFSCRVFILSVCWTFPLIFGSLCCLDGPPMHWRLLVFKDCVVGNRSLCQLAQALVQCMTQPWWQRPLQNIFDLIKLCIYISHIHKEPSYFMYSPSSERLEQVMLQPE